MGSDRPASTHHLRPTNNHAARAASAQPCEDIARFAWGSRSWSEAEGEKVAVSYAQSPFITSKRLPHCWGTVETSSPDHSPFCVDRLLILISTWTLAERGLLHLCSELGSTNSSPCATTSLYPLVDLWHEPPVGIGRPSTLSIIWQIRVHARRNWARSILTVAFVIPKHNGACWGPLRTKLVFYTWTSLSHNKRTADYPAQLCG